MCICFIVVIDCLFVLAPIPYNTCMHWFMEDMVKKTDYGIKLENSMITDLHLNNAESFVGSWAIVEIVKYLMIELFARLG